MWLKNENGSAVRPADIDLTTNRDFVYVRRNITLVPAYTDGDTVVAAHYVWEEMKIPREMWEVCKQVMGHDTALDDVYSALTELAEMIVEG